MSKAKEVLKRFDYDAAESFLQEVETAVQSLVHKYVPGGESPAFSSLYKDTLTVGYLDEEDNEEASVELNFRGELPADISSDDDDGTADLELHLDIVDTTGEGSAKLMKLVEPLHDKLLKETSAKKWAEMLIDALDEYARGRKGDDDMGDKGRGLFPESRAARLAKGIEEVTTAPEAKQTENEDALPDDLADLYNPDKVSVLDQERFDDDRGVVLYQSNDMSYFSPGGKARMSSKTTYNVDVYLEGKFSDTQSHRKGRYHLTSKSEATKYFKQITDDLRSGNTGESTSEGAGDDVINSLKTAKFPLVDHEESPDDYTIPMSGALSYMDRILKVGKAGYSGHLEMNKERKEFQRHYDNMVDLHDQLEDADPEIKKAGREEVSLVMKFLIDAWSSLFSEHRDYEPLKESASEAKQTGMFWIKVGKTNVAHLKKLDKDIEVKGDQVHLDITDDETDNGFNTITFTVGGKELRMYLDTRYESGGAYQFDSGSWKEMGLKDPNQESDPDESKQNEVSQLYAIAHDLFHLLGYENTASVPEEVWREKFHFLGVPAPKALKTMDKEMAQMLKRRAEPSPFSTPDESRAAKLARELGGVTEVRLTKEQKAAQAEWDKEWKAQSSGIQFNIMDLGKIDKESKEAAASGTPMADAIAAVIAKYRQN